MTPPYSSSEAGLGNPFVSHSIWLQDLSMCHLWVNATKSLVMSSICSRAVHLKPLLSRPSAVIFPLCVGLPCVQSPIVTYSVSFSKLCYSFRVTDEGYIKALLWRVLFRRHQHIIQDWDLEIFLVPWSLHASMASFSLSTVGLHHWPLIERFCRLFDINSFIHIRWIVL